MSNLYNGEERRKDIVTLDIVELALRKYLDSYKKDLEGMCDSNVKTAVLEHTAEKAHFEKEEKKQIFETINYVKERTKVKWGFWVPISFIGITSAVNFITMLFKLK